MASAFEALIVHVGHRGFALPLADVEHIVPLSPDFVHCGDQAERYLAFQGSPLNFVSSWNLVGEDTCYHEFAELAAMLPQRRQEHIDWMSALEDSIRSGYPFSKARSPHECAFGIWYYSYRPVDRQLALLLRNFEQPHAFIHGLADQLLALSEAAGKGEALARFQEATDTTLKNLLGLFDRTMDVLFSLQRRIAIILRREDVRYALGADRVSDIVTIPAERVTSNIHRANGADESECLLTLDNGKICPVMEWQ
jgi:hypothetical protein